MSATYDYMIASEFDFDHARQQLKSEGVANPTPAQICARKDANALARKAK